MKLLLPVFLSLFIVLTSCSKGDDPIILTLQNSNLTMHFEDEEEIGAVTNGTKGITYVSSDEYTAEVSDDGIVTAGVIGTADITVSDGHNTKTCKVTVTPRYNYFVDPYFGFGQTEAQVRAKVTTGTLVELDEALGYSYSSGSSLYLYIYEFEDGKLAAVGLLFKVISPYSTNYANYLLERYLLVGENEGMYGFLNKERTVFAGFNPSNTSDGVYITAFMPYEGSARSSLPNFIESINSVNPRFLRHLEKLNLK